MNERVKAGAVKEEAEDDDEGTTCRFHKSRPQRKVVVAAAKSKMHKMQRNKHGNVRSGFS
jgi:hypothetical protein